MRSGRSENGWLAVVFDALVREAVGIGIELPLVSPEAASRLHRIDPVNGDESLICDWCDAGGRHGGSLVVNPDGSFYAEQEIGRRAPSDSGWMVHSIRVWGWNGGEVRSEARLLPLA